MRLAPVVFVEGWPPVGLLVPGGGGAVSGAIAVVAEVLRVCLCHCLRRGRVPFAVRDHGPLHVLQVVEEGALLAAPFVLREAVAGLLHLGPGRAVFLPVVAVAAVAAAAQVPSRLCRGPRLSPAGSAGSASTASASTASASDAASTASPQIWGRQRRRRWVVVDVLDVLVAGHLQVSIVQWCPVRGCVSVNGHHPVVLVARPIKVWAYPDNDVVDTVRAEDPQPATGVRQLPGGPWLHGWGQEPDFDPQAEALPLLVVLPPLLFNGIRHHVPPGVGLGGVDVLAEPLQVVVVLATAPVDFVVFGPAKQQVDVHAAVAAKQELVGGKANAPVNRCLKGEQRLLQHVPTRRVGVVTECQLHDRPQVNVHPLHFAILFQVVACPCP